MIRLTHLPKNFQRPVFATFVLQMAASWAPSTHGRSLTLDEEYGQARLEDSCFKVQTKCPAPLGVPENRPTGSAFTFEASADDGKLKKQIRNALNLTCT